MSLATQKGCCGSAVFGSATTATRDGIILPESHPMKILFHEIAQRILYTEEVVKKKVCHTVKVATHYCSIRDVILESVLKERMIVERPRVEKEIEFSTNIKIVHSEEYVTMKIVIDMALLSMSCEIFQGPEITIKYTTHCPLVIVVIPFDSSWDSAHKTKCNMREFCQCDKKITYENNKLHMTLVNFKSDELGCPTPSNLKFDFINSVVYLSSDDGNDKLLKKFRLELEYDTLQIDVELSSSVLPPRLPSVLPSSVPSVLVAPEPALVVSSSTIFKESNEQQQVASTPSRNPPTTDNEPPSKSNDVIALEAQPDMIVGIVSKNLEPTRVCMILSRY